jgi:hypothetical protein
MCIAWRKRTRRSRITGGEKKLRASSFELLAKDEAGSWVWLEARSSQLILEFGEGSKSRA